VTTRRTPRIRLMRSIVTREAVAAFRDGRAMDLHVALNLKPWEMSPLRVQTIAEPPRDEELPVWLRSWWRAAALREELIAATD
jgi:hypothetical protein